MKYAVHALLKSEKLRTEKNKMYGIRVTLKDGTSQSFLIPKAAEKQKKVLPLLNERAFVEGNKLFAFSFRLSPEIEKWVKEGNNDGEKNQRLSLKTTPITQNSLSESPKIRTRHSSDPFDNENGNENTREGLHTKVLFASPFSFLCEIRKVGFTFAISSLFSGKWEFQTKSGEFLTPTRIMTFVTVTLHNW